MSLPELPTGITDRLYVVWIDSAARSTIQTHFVLFQRLRAEFKDFQFVSDNLLLCRHDVSDASTPPVDFVKIFEGQLEEAAQWSAVLAGFWSFQFSPEIMSKIEAFRERTGGDGFDEAASDQSE